MFKNAVITAQGLELDAKILAGHASAIFTGIKIGDGVYSGTEDLTQFTAMRSIRQEFAISSVSIINNNTVRLRTVINNTGIASGYYMSELGVYAQDPDKGEILYSIALGVKNKMDYQPSETELLGATSTIDTLTSISNTKDVTLKMGLGAAAAAEDLMQLKEDISKGEIVIETLEPIDTKYPIPAAGETTKVFMGKVKKYIEDTKPLDADMAVYVATTGSDDTGNGSSTKPYKTIQYAINTLPKDLGGYVATVNVADGIYNELVKIARYVNGVLSITGNTTDPTQVVISSSTQSLTVIDNTCRVILKGFKTSGNVNEGCCINTQRNKEILVEICYIESLDNKQDGIVWGGGAISVNKTGFFNCAACIASQTNPSSTCTVANVGDCYGTNNLRVSYIARGILQYKNDIAPHALYPDICIDGGVVVSTSGAKIGTLSYDVTIYVATTGSDSTGEGTSTKPFRSIQKAIDVLPKDLGGHIATINIADGTYEGVQIQGFYSGFLKLLGSEKSIDNLSCNINGGFGIIFCNCVVSVKYMNFVTTQSASLSVTHVSDFQASYVTSVIKADHPGVNMSGVPTFMIDQSRFSNRNIGIIAHDSQGWIAATSGSGNRIGVVSEYGSTIKLIGNGIFPDGTTMQFASNIGGVFFQPNGTQISSLITSGLSCTWGTIKNGGYVRHGNYVGTAMVTVQIQVTTNMVLSAGVTYYIYGFPKPQFSIAASCSHPGRVSDLYITPDGVIALTFDTNIGSGMWFEFSATYLTNS